MRAKTVLKVLALVLVLLNVAGLVTGGCVSTTVPAPLTADQRDLIEGECLDLTVGVEEFGAPVYSDHLVTALRDAGMFTGVEHLEDLDESPDLIASVDSGVSGTAVIPLLTALTAGIVPTTVEERHGWFFSLRAPHAESDTVKVEFRYRGPTTMGLAGMVLNLSPTRARGDVSRNPQVRDGLAYEIAMLAPSIRHLATSPRAR